MAFVVRYAADLLNGVPSIVIGIFAYALVVLPFKHFSTLAGAFALGLMMIPITLRNTEEFLLAVPRPLREGSMALGASKWTTIVRVVVPAAYRGIMTAILLALARVAGETAPLLFTALFSNFWISRIAPHFLPKSINDLMKPTASLAVLIYNFSGSPFENQISLAWTAALVLVVIVLVFNVLGQSLAGRSSD